MAKFRLSVGDMLQVPVKGEFKDGDAIKPFEFTLTVRRMNGADRNNKRSALDFLKQETTDWQGQRLVIDEETGQPAAFSKEAVAFLFDEFFGMDGFCWDAYVAAMKVSETAAGRSGN